jgi:hypothetical protein
MTSVRHDAPLELIRQCPPVAAELFRAVTGNSEERLAAENVRATLGPTDLSEVVPVQFLADSVVVLSDSVTGENLLAIIVEPQGRDEVTKKFSWPVYVAVVRRVLRCQYAFLLVICPDPAEADKCRAVIRTGHPGFDLGPAVIDPLSTPGADGGSPHLTVFAACMGAIDMREKDGARQVLSAIRESGTVDADRNRLTAIIMNLASDAARLTLEALMSTMDWTTHPFIEGFKNEGREEGREVGREEGRKEGRTEATAATRAEDVLKIIDSRRIKITAKQRAKVTASAGLETLGKWFDRAITATSADDIFKD